MTEKKRSPEEIESQRQFGARISLEAAVMRKMGVPEHDPDRAEEWIEKYSALFKEIFESKEGKEIRDLTFQNVATQTDKAIDLMIESLKNNFENK